MRLSLLPLLPLPLLALAACGDVNDPHSHDDDNEVVTTVELTFTPAAGEASTFVWTDPEDDGAPVIDTIVLPVGQTYDVAVRFLNGLEDPPEDLTSEIDDEAEEHQVFFTGTAIERDGAARLTVDYDDTDANGLPVGLAWTAETVLAGEGDLTVTLRHLPTQGDSQQKVAGLAETVLADGFGGIGGDNDAQVTFPVDVQE